MVNSRFVNGQLYDILFFRFLLLFFLGNLLYKCVGACMRVCMCRIFDKGKNMYGESDFDDYKWAKERKKAFKAKIRNQNKKPRVGKECRQICIATDIVCGNSFDNYRLLPIRSAYSLTCIYGAFVFAYIGIAYLPKAFRRTFDSTLFVFDKIPNSGRRKKK